MSSHLRYDIHPFRLTSEYYADIILAEPRAPGQHQRLQGRHGQPQLSSGSRFDDDCWMCMKQGLEDGWHMRGYGLKDLC